MSMTALLDRPAASGATVVRLPVRPRPSRVQPGRVRPAAAVRSCRGPAVGPRAIAPARVQVRPQPQRSAQSSTQRSTLRLTQRGRVVVVLLVVAVAGVLLSLGRMSAGAAPTHPAPVRVTVVAPGESLWAVAERVAPSSDPRTEVGRLAAANGLSDGASLQPGQRLRVP